MVPKRLRDVELDDGFIRYGAEVLYDTSVFDPDPEAVDTNLYVDDIFDRELERYLESEPPQPPTPAAVQVQRIETMRPAKIRRISPVTLARGPSQCEVAPVAPPLAARPEPNALAAQAEQGARPGEDDRPFLILDLDHTVLQSLSMDGMAPVHRQFLEQNRDGGVGGLHLVESINVCTKIRPSAREFVKEVGEFYQIIIYTMGELPYALAMGELLDPECRYLSPNRVIARDPVNMAVVKSLDVAGVPATSVVIVDDTPEVWSQKEHTNLFKMPRYKYFGPNSVRKDEGEKNPLSSLAPILVKLANAYKEKGGGDIREMIPQFRSKKKKC